MPLSVRSELGGDWQTATRNAGARPSDVGVAPTALREQNLDGFRAVVVALLKLVESRVTA